VSSGPQDSPAHTFTGPEKIPERGRRGETWRDSESRQRLERAIENGRGGCYSWLTPEQYRKAEMAHSPKTAEKNR
jgi:hypothetical protein